VPPDFPSLTAAAGAGPQSDEAEAVTAEELGPLVAEAIARWSETGLDEAQLEELQSAKVAVADLPGAALGIASEAANTIWIDVDAAGNGWFVDSTPVRDEEFRSVGAASRLEAIPGDAADRVDLLTVLAHEMGHLLGLEDLDPVARAHDLMAATLGTGVRRLPVTEPHLLAAAESGHDDTPLASPAQADPVDELARREVFARVDGWLAADIDDLVEGRSHDASDEEEDERLWLALYGQQ
jgi:hypothetical protein